MIVNETSPGVIIIQPSPLREKCPYSEFFWSVFSHIQTEYGDAPYLSVFKPNARKYGPEKL